MKNLSEAEFGAWCDERLAAFDLPHFIALHWPESRADRVHPTHGGEAMAAIAAEEMTPEEQVEKQKNLDKQKEKPMRAPVVIAVAAEPSEEERVETLEEYGAVYASIQNILLAAHALGLAAFWRTGSHCYHPKMNEQFGLGEQGKVLGLIYIGYPMREMKEGRRRPVEQVTTWITEA